MKDESALKAESRLAFRKKVRSAIAVACKLAGMAALAGPFYYVFVFAGLRAPVEELAVALVVSVVGSVACVGGDIIAYGVGDDKIDFIIRIIDFIKNLKIKESNKIGKAKESKISQPSRYKLLKITGILFSAKTQKEVFLQNMADWDNEIYEALKKGKDAKLFMINVRNTYAFLAAMWMKSPIGNLIEFVVKIAKG